MDRTPFKGSWLNAIDANGRVSLPAQFRKVIAERCAGAGIENPHEFAIRKHPSDPCLQAFDPVFEAAFGAREERNAEDDDALLFARGRTSFGGLMPVGYDQKSGRMVIGAVQRRLGGIEAGEDAQLLFVGANQTFELWYPATAREFLAESAPDIVAQLEALLEEGREGRKGKGAVR
ncbi:MAG: hypothetical protein H7X93_11905 [Sphingomonadaceae bacterium]|nr:hypothetical protein [Sphingomonadaceae bacterium]